MELLLALLLGILPLLGCLLWWWNELWFAAAVKRRYSGTGTKLPPGHMGLPYFGELFTFLWYFKVLRRPDDFINAKRRKYGDGVGLYRTHLFGSPTIIACFPEINKLVFQTEDTFIQQWPTIIIMGRLSLVAVHGPAHARLRKFVLDAISRPDALRRIALHVQPSMLASFQSWANHGKINTYEAIKKMNFEIIGKLFVSFEPGPLLDTMKELFAGVLKGVRAHPLNFPGTTYYHATQCWKKLAAMFMLEVEKRKKLAQNGEKTTNDLLDGLMQIKDEEGNKLSDQEVLDNIVGLVTGGYESTTLASMWAIYYLSKFPHVLDKLREENRALSKNKAGDFITSEDVSKLGYTKKVVEEVVRLANVSVFVSRLVTNEVEYKGYVIPKNWKVIVWQRYLHTNPENFEDPFCFNPDRWNQPARPGTFLPFGAGLRLCPGQMVAQLQLALFLHHLCVGYKWELVNPNAEMIYLPHQKPVDGVEVTFSELKD
jgi:ent-kaurenoic acid hydroxylase